jgi:hypothetical protein
MAMIKRALLAAMILLLFKPAHARFVTDYKYPTDNRGWSWFPSFYFEGGLETKYGTMVSQDQRKVPKVNLSGIGASGHVGWAPSFFNVGIGGEYVKWNQITDISKVGNINVTGTQIGTFVLAGLHFSKITFLSKYFLTSTYEFSQTSSFDTQVSLRKLEPSFSFELLYHASHFITYGLSYGSINYKSYQEASTKGTLTEEQKTELKRFGLKLGILF